MITAAVKINAINVDKKRNTKNKIIVVIAARTILSSTDLRELNLKKMRMPKQTAQ